MERAAGSRLTPEPLEARPALDPDERRLQRALGAIAAGELVAILDEAGLGVLVAAAERMATSTGARLHGRRIQVESSAAVPRRGELRDLVQAALELVSLAEVDGSVLIAEARDAEDLIGVDRTLPWLSVTEVTRLGVRARVSRVAAATLPIDGSDLVGIGYASRDGGEHLALLQGEIRGRREVLLELHGQCLAGQALGSTACRCGARLQEGLDRLRETAGILVQISLPPGEPPIPCLRPDRRLRHRAATIAAAIVRDLAPATVWLGEPDDLLSAQLGHLVAGAGFAEEPSPSGSRVSVG